MNHPFNNVSLLVKKKKHIDAVYSRHTLIETSKNFCPHKRQSQKLKQHILANEFHL